MREKHYNIIETLSDRICALQVYVNNVVVFSVIGVYLPYNDCLNLELYLETMDELHHIIEMSDPFHSSHSLTQACQTQCYWRQIGTKNPSNNRSVTLFIFLLDHQMIVAILLISRMLVIPTKGK